MIPEYCLTEWRQQVPWVRDYQVEQDLIISRVLVSLYENPKIKDNIVFCGGTALHKLYIKPVARYSEDIDLVQIKSASIGPDVVLKVFLAHCNKDNQNANRALFEKNLHEKIRFDDFPMTSWICLLIAMSGLLNMHMMSSKINWLACYLVNHGKQNKGINKMLDESTSHYREIIDEAIRLMSIYFHKFIHLCRENKERI